MRTTFVPVVIVFVNILSSLSIYFKRYQINSQTKPSLFNKFEFSVFGHQQKENNGKHLQSKTSPRKKETFGQISKPIAGEGIRINKCLIGLSRRAADEAISNGRVTINGNIVTTAGCRVVKGNIVRLDGQVQQWQEWSDAKQEQPAREAESRKFVYVKYWKPPGVTCTSDRADKTNIIQQGGFHLFPQRLFTVGRLDKDSSGLILLTSDGRVNNAVISN
jgi:23S rRNA-/tRNA-specific pseudouridylate synthase